MGIIETLNTTYLSWLINMPYFWSILIVSLVVTVLTTLIYKFATNQAELKRIKEDMKRYQEEAKKHSKTNPKKAMELQKKMFSLSGDQMKHSFSSMIYTFLPVILIFGWMSASLAYQPILPGQEFDITIYSENAQLTSVPELKILDNKTVQLDNQLVTVFTLQGADAGKYTIQLEKAGVKNAFEVLITSEQRYYGPVFNFKNSILNKAVVSNAEVKPLGNFSIFGWLPGWLGTYMILTIILSSLVRKLLKVY